MINKKEKNQTIKFTEKNDEDIFYLRVDFLNNKGVIKIIAAKRLVFGEINGGNYDEKYEGKLPGYARTENVNLSFYKAVIKHLVEAYPEKIFAFSGSDDRRTACYLRFFKNLDISVKPWGKGFTFQGK